MQQSHLQYVVEFDIKGFFDNVDHAKLIKQMWALGIRDKRLIYIVKRILKAPIQLENGTTVTPVKGTPQGGIISPLLANIVLNELDWWVESQWADNPVAVARGKNRLIGGSMVFDKSHGYTAMRRTHLKEMHIVRYADDFRIFCQNKDSAERTLIAVTKWLKERLRLDVSPEKTRVVNLNKHYSEFLGIKMRLTKKKDKLVVQSRVSEKAVKRIKAEAKQKIKNIARPPKGMTEATLVLIPGCSRRFYGRKSADRVLHMQITVYRSFVRNMESVPSLDKYLKHWETSTATTSSLKTKVAGITTKI